VVAAFEHIPHIRDIFSVEVGEIEASQVLTTIEHINHTRNIGSAEVCEIEKA